MVADKNIQVIPISNLTLWEKAKKNRTLLSVTLEMTARCNNNCSHCYINLPEGDTDAMARELTFGEIRSLIDESVSMGALWFLLTGGEPLLRSDFGEIYLYLKKKGVLVSVFTNASLISDEHINLFKKYPPRDIEVTIYGVTEKTHRKVTRKNDFSTTMNGVEKLVSAGLKVTLKSTIMRSNYKELDAISTYCRNRSSSPFRFDPFLQLRIDGDSEKNETIHRERLTPDEIVQIEHGDKQRREALSVVCNDIGSGSFAPEIPDRLFRCRAGINSCCIGFDGVFKLCSALNHLACTYDLKTGSLADAWYNFTPAIRRTTSGNEFFINKCGSCTLVDICMWCPAHAYLETGDLEAHVPYFCDLAEKRRNSFKEV